MPDYTSSPPTVNSSSFPAVVWGDFTFTAEDIVELRSALRHDCPSHPDFTDEAIRQMAYDTISIIALVIELKEYQRVA